MTASTKIYNATVSSTRQVAKDLFILRITPEFNIPDFQAGQFVAIGLQGNVPKPPGFPPDQESLRPDKLIRRAFSIASSPTEKSFLEFCVATVHEGILSPRLSVLKEGDHVWVAEKITGNFTLHHVPEGKNLILVATGTGIAPYKSMLGTPDIFEHYDHITLVHGVRYRSDLLYQSELLQLVLENDQFSYYGTVSREEGDENTHKGYVQQLFERGTIRVDPQKDHIFLCGNPAMIEDMEVLLTGLGCVSKDESPDGNIHTEKYWK